MRHVSIGGEAVHRNLLENREARPVPEKSYRDLTFGQFPVTENAVSQDSETPEYNTPMSALVLGRRIIVVGVVSSILGMILYSQIGNVGHVWINFSVTLSFAMTIVGALALLIGCGMWGYRAPMSWLLWSALSVGAIGFMVGEFGNINIHGPTAILMFVVFAAVAIVGLLVLIAVARFISFHLKNRSSRAEKAIFR